MLGARLLARDAELVAFDRLDPAIAELAVKDTLADLYVAARLGGVARRRSLDFKHARDMVVSLSTCSSGSSPTKRDGIDDVHCP